MASKKDKRGWLKKALLLSSPPLVAAYAGAKVGAKIGGAMRKGAKKVYNKGKEMYNKMPESHKKAAKIGAMASPMGAHYMAAKGAAKLMKKYKDKKEE